MGVYKRDGSDVWWVRYSIGGRLVRESTGTNRKAEAEAILAKRRLAAFHGEEFPEKREKGLTIGGLRDLWMSVRDGKRSIDTDRGRFRTLVDLLGEGTLLASVTPTEIEKVRASLETTSTRLGKPMTPTTVRRHLELLRAAFNLAKRLRHHHRDPMSGMKLPKLRNERDRIATLDEYDQLVANANHKLRTIIVVCYWSAMRLGEVCNLSWRQIDLEKGLVRLHSSETKTDEARIVPLAKDAIAALVAWKDEHGEEFDGRVFDVDATSISPLFSRLVERLEIKDLHCHDLRHGALTRLRRAGVDLFTMKAISGHKTMEMLARYQTVQEDDLVGAMAKAEELEASRTKKTKPKQPSKKPQKPRRPPSAR